MEAKFESLVSQRLGNDKAMTALYDSIPSAQDPVLGPVVKNVYEQALKVSGNDSKKAIGLTKDMLKAMGERGAGDMGLEFPPDASGGGSNRRNQTDWTKALGLNR
jgi:hypothetical protein